MTKITDLPELTDPVDSDWMYAFDSSSPGAPDKKLSLGKMRPAGSRMTNVYRFSGPVAVPAIATSAEVSATFTLSGVRAGDHVIFNPIDSLPANVIIASVRISADDTISVRLRNLSGTVAVDPVSVQCSALAIRAQA